MKFNILIIFSKWKFLSELIHFKKVTIFNLNFKDILIFIKIQISIFFSSEFNIIINSIFKFSNLDLLY